jgi:CRP-like cAMP-binding protein
MFTASVMDRSNLNPGHLRRIQSLSLLSEVQLAAFLKCVDVVLCEQSSRLFSEAQSGDALYMIVEGELRVFVEQQGGQVLLLRTLEANDTFGELSLLNNTPRSASVEAITDCTLLKVSSTVLEKLMAEQPEAASLFLYHMARTLGSQLADLTTKLRNFRGQVDLLSAL